MSNLTNMFDSRFIPQMIESPVESIIRKIEGDTETYICNRLMELNIDKDILMNQTQEIKRLNGVIAEYERLEEQGLFLRLPCKVGDTVYSVVKDGLQIIELEFSLDFYARRKRDFGKTVFLTKEEAEHALKQIGE